VKIILAIIIWPLLLYWLAATYFLKPRLSALEATGNRIVKDYGTFSQNRIFGFQQTLRLLRVEKDGREYFLMEERGRRFASLIPYVHWLKIDQSAANNIINILEASVS
jgi:hypothetical protein